MVANIDTHLLMGFENIPEAKTLLENIFCLNALLEVKFIQKRLNICVFQRIIQQMSFPLDAMLQHIDHLQMFYFSLATPMTQHLGVDLQQLDCFNDSFLNSLHDSFRLNSFSADLSQLAALLGHKISNGLFAIENGNCFVLFFSKLHQDLFYFEFEELLVHSLYLFEVF